MSPVDISASSSAAAQSGQTGSFIVNSGGGKQSITLYIVAGLVAVVGLVIWWKKSK